MAERRLKVLVALADRARAGDVAAYLAEEEGMLVTLASALAADDHAAEPHDAVLSGPAALDPVTPQVVLGEPPAGHLNANILAVLPAQADEKLIAAALRLAAAGYRIGTAAPAVRDIEAAGSEHFLSSGESDLAASARAAVAASLTQRERQVLALLAEGAPNKLIARRLDISVHTAKFHVAALLQKLGAINRTDAIAIAMREGLVLV